MLLSWRISNHIIYLYTEYQSVISLGNHGEDVKECYYYLDSTPTHSYMKGLYKYPQSEYPYSQLERENRERGLHKLEYELSDSGEFKNHSLIICGKILREFLLRI